MSVAANSILKLLSHLSSAADKIVQENSSQFKSSRISDWVVLVKNKADRIVESETTESVVIPTLVPFLKGSIKRGPRVSDVLRETETQKLHVHRKSKNDSTYIRRSSRKTSLRLKSVKNTIKPFLHSEKRIHNPKLKTPPKVIEKDSASLIEKEANALAVQTSVIGSSKIINTSSKRKKSSELSLEYIKKSKVNNSELNGARETHTENVNGEKKLMKAKNSSLLPMLPTITIKSSVGANGVLKGNHMLRSKMETKHEKAVENRKNILALRQQKLQENKKLREEKMERSLQQRIKETKSRKLRSGKVTPKTMSKTAGNEALGETSNPTKGIESFSVREREKLCVQKNFTKAGTSIISKSNQKAPHTKHEKMNITYVATEEQSSTSSKVLKDSRTPSSKAHKNSTKALLPKTMKQLTNSSTPVQKKGPESYAITPARSSFVSYDISEIRSDSEDEEVKSNSKPIPSWATGVRLRNALLQQYHHPLNTDQLFGNFFDPPDLALIMGIKKKQYNKRTSSAVWNSFSLEPN